jgi:hypothetical protein
MTDVPTDAELLAATQADLAGCLEALMACEEALGAIVRETGDCRYGRANYDATLDHIYEEAMPALEAARKVLP